MNDKALYELFGELYDHKTTPADAYMKLLAERRKTKKDNAKHGNRGGPRAPKGARAGKR